MNKVFGCSGISVEVAIVFEETDLVSNLDFWNTLNFDPATQAGITREVVKSSFDLNLSKI